MKKIVILSCGKSKLNRACAARDLYIGDLFRKSLAYARSLCPDTIYILSAKHGLLELDDVVEPYEMTLNKMGKTDRKNWAERVLAQLREQTDFTKASTSF